MNKLLVVVGPTAAGKTELGIEMAKKFRGELVSADSRQVYKDLNIGTGKDIPVGAKAEYIKGYPVYEINGVKLWGYDLVDPKEEFSVAQYVVAAKNIIEIIWEKNKLPIIVGGTGFYVQALISGIETLDIPQNKPLRRQLELMATEDLFEILAQLDASKAASLNISDRRNKVRLIRAIEVADAKIRGVKSDTTITPLNADTFFVGITSDRKIINSRIKSRVIKRVKMGAVKEIELLIDKGVIWQDQSMSSLGYRQWRDYFERGKSEEMVIKEWISEEQKYAKRQMTWFRRKKNINWFDISAPDYHFRVEQIVKKWYSSINHEIAKN